MENVSMNIYYVYAYNRPNVSMNTYYVYAYIRPDGTPYYIGKGHGNRAYEKHKHIPVPKDKSRIVKLHENMSEKEAFAKEIELIKHYGRKNNGTGILLNSTDGGEGTSGRIQTAETRQKISEALTGEKHPMYGKKLSDETLQKMSEAKTGKKHSAETRRKLREANTGEKNPFFGKKHSAETLQKMSEAKTGKTASPETRKKMREAHTGKKNAMYGKTVSPETRRKLSEAHTGKKNAMYGKTVSPETRRIMSEANKAAWARRRLTKYTYDENSLRE